MSRVLEGAGRWGVRDPSPCRGSDTRSPRASRGRRAREVSTCSKTANTGGDGRGGVGCLLQDVDTLRGADAHELSMLDPTPLPRRATSHRPHPHPHSYPRATPEGASKFIHKVCKYKLASHSFFLGKKRKSAALWLPSVFSGCCVVLNFHFWESSGIAEMGWRVSVL